MSVTQPHFYEFGDFHLDSAKRLLSKRGGEIVPLMPKAYDTLLYLVEHAGKVVGKDEMMAAIWPDTIVEENNLSQNISILRRILGEKRGEHLFVATIPGHGFKFVAEVRRTSDPGFQIAGLETAAVIEGEESQHKDKIVTNDGHYLHEEGRRPRFQISKWRIALVVVGVTALVSMGFYFRLKNDTAFVHNRIETIAVLPFKSLVAENRDEALEMGMANALISRLGSNRDLIIRPLSSVRRYDSLEQDAAQAGRSLGVESVLDGNIQRWGDKIRVNVRLIRVADANLLWTETFDEKFTDIFVVQDEISRKVAGALTFRLGDEQKRLVKHPTENIEAYQLYLKGNFHQSKGTAKDLQKSVDDFQQAIALDPNFALAYVGLAFSYAPLAHLNDADARSLRLKAKAATLKGLQLDDQLLQARIALGNLLYKDEYDFASAERELRSAVELNPNDTDARQAYGELLTYLGRTEESLAELRRALEIDPVSSGANWKYGQSLFFARQYDAAVAQAKTTLELDDTYWWTHRTLAFTYQMTGDYAGSVEERAKINDLVGKPELAQAMRQSFAQGGWLGFLRTTTAKQRELGLPPYVAMTFYLELGE